MPAALKDTGLVNRAELPYVSDYCYEERVVAREPKCERHLQLLVAYENVADASVEGALGRGDLKDAVGDGSRVVVPPLRHHAPISSRDSATSRSLKVASRSSAAKSC